MYISPGSVFVDSLVPDAGNTLPVIRCLGSGGNIPVKSKRRFLRRPIDVA
ncbi:hypothetical protein L21SP2_0935 [Salinispira pacifica]|uniref:Uncharacterized protein n=1 Tax=Salinispira pacifica TaxID=1307761 RepID=V5WFD4_9SPIO|nr:hypothetical protein L21SP2_0935 [Salinispira pacifica]